MGAPAPVGKDCEFPHNLTLPQGEERLQWEQRPLEGLLQRRQTAPLADPDQRLRDGEEEKIVELHVILLIEWGGQGLIGT